MKSKCILDTNILIRFFTNDPKEQASFVENLLKTVDDKSLLIPDVVLVETVYVLLSVYELSKEDVIDTVSSLITYPKFKLHGALFQKTLDLYSKYPISFVDAYIGAVSNANPVRTIYTFDKKMLSIKEIKAVKPNLPH